MVKKDRNNLTKKEVDYLANFKWQSSNNYCTPKVHKCKRIQEAIAFSPDDYIEVFQPEDLKIQTKNIWSGKPNQTTHLPNRKPVKTNSSLSNYTYVKYDWDFLRFLSRSLNFDNVLCSCDIESLYISIPVDLGIEAIDSWITRKRNLIPERFTKEFIIDSIKFILKKNNFLFDSKMFN